MGTALAITDRCCTTDNNNNSYGIYIYIYIYFSTHHSENIAQGEGPSRTRCHAPTPPQHTPARRPCVRACLLAWRPSCRVAHSGSYYCYSKHGSMNHGWVDGWGDRFQCLSGTPVTTTFNVSLRSNQRTLNTKPRRRAVDDERRKRRPHTQQ